ncbi:CCN family member 3 [Suncus etruscus]|uniref:CCN family member 3 n=1 Tax=Suncus etruscus TaxID=109475 RepID=UPI0021104F7F|nr:CCN family member 3 [Suncus etruscus]
MVPTRSWLALLLSCLARAQVAGTERCATPCPASCPEKPVCAPGVNVAKDHCSCCLVCARQRGESCSDLSPCQAGSGLFCDRSADPSNRTGICMAVVGDNCVFAGIIYQSGVTFQPNCQFQCTCQDGQVACVPRCDEDVLMPGPECPVPRKIKVPGECCEKWVCDSNETLPDFLTLPAYRSEATVGVVSDSSVNCIEQTTEWSACSKSCGMGISTRVTNKNQQCEMVKQIRLCMVRPCGQEHRQPKVKKGKKCLRTMKPPNAIHLHFDNCTSLDTYKPRFCGMCSDGRCCTPHNTRTMSVDFECFPGQFIRKPVMLIRTCTCHSNCPQNNEAFIQDLRPNTHRGGI